jgi:heterodisulfide reductase subunit A-like polyferredoxin
MQFITTLLVSLITWLLLFYEAYAFVDKFATTRLKSSLISCRPSVLNALRQQQQPPLATQEKRITDVLVVGSGISGSTAAYYVNKFGKNVILAEVNDEVGGNIISKKGN